MAKAWGGMVSGRAALILWAALAAAGPAGKAGGLGRPAIAAETPARISAAAGLESTSAAALERTTAYDQSFLSGVLPAGPQGPWRVTYRVLLPKGYDASRTYPVLYFLHGRGGDRFLIEGLGFQAQMDRLVDEGGAPFIVIAPDGGNSYWMNAALKDERWGDVVTQELVRDVESKLPVRRDPAGRAIGGVSMGGHGAIQLSLNYPGVFGAIGAHSAVFRTQEEAIRDFYYEFGTGEAYQNRDPFSLIRLKGKKLPAPLWMDIGGQDPWLRNTRNFAALVREQGYEAELHIAEDAVGGHELGYWQYHLPTYLRWYARQFARQAAAEPPRPAGCSGAFAAAGAAAG